MKVFTRLLFSITLIVLAVSMAVTFVPQTKAESPNLVANAGFESASYHNYPVVSGFDHAQIRTDNWSNVCWTDPFSGIKHSGSYSLKICYGYPSPSPRTDDAVGVYQDIVVTPYTEYTFKFWARVDNANKAVLRVGFRNPKASDVWAPIVEESIAESDISTTFKEYTYTFNVGSLDTIRLFFYSWGQGQCSYRAFYIDDVSLVEAPSKNIEIVNNSFESNILDGSASNYNHYITASNWVNTLGSTLSTMQYVDGTQSLKLDYSKSVGEITNALGVYQDITLGGDYIYSVKFSAKVENDNKTNLVVGFRDANADDIWQTVQSVVVPASQLTTSFVEFSVDIEPGELTSIRLFFSAESQTESAGAFYIDNVSVKINTYAMAEKVQVVRTQAITHLEQYALLKNYRPEQRWAVVQAIERGIVAIENASDETSIANALASAKQSIDLIKTDAQLTAEELVLYKPLAKQELDGYVDLSNYAQAQQTAIAEAIDNAKRAIDNATTREQVAEAVSIAKATIDSLPTLANPIEGVRNQAKLQLDEYVSLDNYRDAQKAIVLAIVAKAKQDIDLATTESAIATIVSNAQTLVDGIQTDAELTAQEQLIANKDNQLADANTQIGNLQNQVDDLKDQVEQLKQPAQSSANLTLLWVALGVVGGAGLAVVVVLFVFKKKSK